MRIRVASVYSKISSSCSFIPMMAAIIFSCVPSSPNHFVTSDFSVVSASNEGGVVFLRVIFFLIFPSQVHLRSFVLAQWSTFRWGHRSPLVVCLDVEDEVKTKECEKRDKSATDDPSCLFTPTHSLPTQSRTKMAKIPREYRCAKYQKNTKRGGGIVFGNLLILLR